MPQRQCATRRGTEAALARIPQIPRTGLVVVGVKAVMLRDARRAIAVLGTGGCKQTVRRLRRLLYRTLPAVGVL
jgi:hypothetical protein